MIKMSSDERFEIKDDRFKIEGHDSDIEDNDFQIDESATTVAKNKQILSKEKVKEYNKKLEKRGVVYLSRIPPFMKPAKVKHLLEQHGIITKVYLLEEDSSSRKRRKKAGGNSGKKYTEGWVEFENKKAAKRVAESLNNTQIGGRKRHFYREDIWNIKYLKKFKWRHLTEKIAYEKRVREQKLRMEMMQAKKDNAQYMELVEKGKQFKKMDEKKRKRSSDKNSADDNLQHPNIRRRFKQLEGSFHAAGNASTKLGSDLLKSVFATK